MGKRWDVIKMNNPWLRPAPKSYPVAEIQSYSVEDRLEELKYCDSWKLQEIIRWQGTQKTVKRKAEILLRRRIKNADKSGRRRVKG